MSKKAIIDIIEGCEDFGIRYEGVKCVNYDPTAPSEQRGAFSLIFKAYDKELGKEVAIKLMDPDALGDTYRLESFRRESIILKTLVGKERCLQLLTELNKYTVGIEVSEGNEISIPCDFFVVEWLEEEIDEYFLSQDAFSAKEKLEIFREITLAVQSIHNNNVHHRDLKYDNVRVKTSKRDKKIVVAIDFGTAAKYDTANIKIDYNSGAAGHMLYSAPEARVGFAGDRTIGRYTDIYALGCILFELFNIKSIVEMQDSEYYRALSILAYDIAQHRTMPEKIKAWNDIIVMLKSLIVSPPLNQDGHTIPPSIEQILNRLFQRLIAFDFNHRIYDFTRILRYVDTSMHILDNEFEAKRLIAYKKEIRRRRKLKIEEKDARMRKFMDKRRKITC